MTLELGVFSGALRGWQPEQVALAAAEAGLETLEWEVGAGDRRHISLGSLETDAGHCALVSERAGLSVCGVCGDASLSILSPQDMGSLLAACTAAGVTQARMFAPAPARGAPIASQLNVPPNAPVAARVRVTRRDVGHSDTGGRHDRPGHRDGQRPE
jgi:hypothetical protein